MALIVVLINVTVNELSSNYTATTTVTCNSSTLTVDSSGYYELNVGDFVLFVSLGLDSSITTGTHPNTTITSITPTSVDIFNGTIAALPDVTNMFFGVVAAPKGSQETFTVVGNCF